MKKTRVAVFETNSSSTHSISIASSGDLTDRLLVEDDGACQIYPGEFGWEEETFWDATSKASYCLTYCKQSGRVECEEMLKRVIMERTGASEVLFMEYPDRYYPWGHIDHQSHEVCEEAFQNEENLAAFIFNPKSYLRTDNDNH